jgi:hypothetical protein
MPNHCYQTVTICGDKNIIEELYEQVKEHGRFCEVVNPMPLEVWGKPVEGEYSTPSWYNWRVDNWGTKWDIADAYVAEKMSVDDDGVAQFTFICWTAWSPPIPVWDRLVSIGISVHATYEDEGMMFEGEYMDGVDHTWEPIYEEDQDGCMVKVEV